MMLNPFKQKIMQVIIHKFLIINLLIIFIIKNFFENSKTVYKLVGIIEFFPMTEKQCKFNDLFEKY